MTTEPKAGARAPRVTSRRHPLLRARPRGVWYADLAGVIRSYPKTQEDYDKLAARNRIQIARLVAEGKWNRKGIPDGWAGRRQEVADIRDERRSEAKGIVKNMIEQGLVAVDDTRAEEALETLVAIIRDKDTVEVRTRVAAAGKLLEFTKQKPAARSDVTLNKAEDFLAALVAKD